MRELSTCRGSGIDKWSQRRNQPSDCNQHYLRLQPNDVQISGKARRVGPWWGGPSESRRSGSDHHARGSGCTDGDKCRPMPRMRHLLSRLDQPALDWGRVPHPATASVRIQAVGDRPKIIERGPVWQGGISDQQAEGTDARSAGERRRAPGRLLATRRDAG